jgi:hypothetical protein
VVDAFWVDKATFVILKADYQGYPKGTKSFEVSSITFDAHIADSVFWFAPPAGARVFSNPAPFKQGTMAFPSGHARTGAVASASRWLRWRAWGNW